MFVKSFRSVKCPLSLAQGPSSSFALNSKTGELLTSSHVTTRGHLGGGESVFVSAIAHSITYISKHGMNYLLSVHMRASSDDLQIASICTTMCRHSFYTIDCRNGFYCFYQPPPRNATSPIKAFTLTTCTQAQESTA